MVQPVGHVLARDAQRRAVFHQADVMDVGNLGAADARVDPAHHVPQDALDVVVEFMLHLVGQRQVAGQRRRQQGIGARGGLAGEFALHGGHVHPVVMQHMQRGGGG